jgi:hypothetical protein
MAAPLTFDLSILGPADFSVDVIGGEVTGGTADPGGIVAPPASYPFGGLVQVRYGRFSLETNAKQRYFNMIGMRCAGSGRDVLVPLWTDRMQPDTITATLDGAHVAEATTVAISVTVGTLQGGEWFGIDHATAGERVYGISEIISTVDLGGGAFDYTVTIDPPLRDAAADAATLTFSRPLCLMRVPGGDTTPWEIDANRLSRPSVVFIEAEW